jgi:hypothetical protein
MSADSVMIQLWRGSLIRTFRSLDTTSSRRIKLQEDFLLRIDFRRMSAASVVIQLWRGSLIRTFRSLDIATRRRIKLQVLFLPWIDFQRMCVVSVLIQLGRGSRVRTSRALDIASRRRMVKGYDNHKHRVFPDFESQSEMGSKREKVFAL